MQTNFGEIRALRGFFSLEKRSLRQFAIFRRIFATSIVSIRVSFRALVRGVRIYAANFRAIISSTRKFEGNFQVKTCAVLCKVRCDVNRNHPSRCCVVADWNISSNVSRVFHKDNYNADFIKRNIDRPSEADETNWNATPVTTVTLHYIKGTSETISRILQPYSIRVAHKPTTTLRHLLTNVKDKDEPNNMQTGSSLQDQMLRLPGFLHWWNWQKP